MKLLGLDIGTTTISGVVLEGQKVLSHITLGNDAFLTGTPDWEKSQNTDHIRKTAVQAVDTLLKDHPDVARIGITGQMHGILYLDENGSPVSPLYTWQDGRGNLPYENTTYAGYLSELTGYPLATGYGMVTHFYNLKNGLVPENARVFSTIHDYIAMVLAGQARPVTDRSDAASFGLFNVATGEYDIAALEKAGIEESLLPAIAGNTPIGAYQNIPVYAAIGDNQASFLGATQGVLQRMLLNIGTGSQFSVYTQDYLQCPGLETRPFPGGGFLVVGAALCGGRAYALWERFLRNAAQTITGETVVSGYEAMGKLLSENPKPENIPQVTPLFQGTRENPGLRGSITDISTENFTPLHFTWGVLEGMAEELYDMYRRYLESGGKPAALIGSGNGLRKNPFLKACFEERFQMPVTLSQCEEEAATGAALFAASQN